MKDNFTRIAMLLDRSGSMLDVADATVEGFNRFIAEQRKLPGKCVVSLDQFDTEYDRVFYPTSVEAFPVLTREIYVPRGGTALLDAQARVIDNLGAELSRMADSERPGKVFVVFQTDGQENSSRHTTLDAVHDRIAQQRDQYGWVFLYLAANQDAIAQAAKIGLRSQQAVTYNNTVRGMGNTMSAASNFVARGRAMGSAFTGQNVNVVVQDMAFTAEERKEAMEEQAGRRPCTSGRVRGRRYGKPEATGRRHGRTCTRRSTHHLAHDGVYAPDRLRVDAHPVHVSKIATHGDVCLLLEGVQFLFRVFGRGRRKKSRGGHVGSLWHDRKGTVGKGCGVVCIPHGKAPQRGALC